MIFLQKHFCGVFELPLPRNARKRTKKNQEKESRMVGGWVWDLASVRGGLSGFFPTPRCGRLWGWPAQKAISPQIPQNSSNWLVQG
jgi:hypothetical protein